MLNFVRGGIRLPRFIQSRAIESDGTCFKKPELEVSEAFLQQMSQLSVWLNCEDVDEIYLDCHRGVRVVYRSMDTMAVDLNWSKEQIVDFLLELAWRTKVRLDPFMPFGGGVVPHMPWRWHAVIPPMSPEGPILVLRRQRFAVMSINDYVLENFNAQELQESLLGGKSLLVFGATGSGKSTLLMAILKEFFVNKRVGFAESTAELPLLSEHWFKLLAVPQDTSGRGGVDFGKVVSEMMRLSPQSIVLGEIRGEEARQFVEFSRTGHGGVLSTIHSGSFADVQSRLTYLSRISLDDLPPLLGLQITKVGKRFHVQKHD